MDYEVIKSKRKTISLSVSREGKVTVRTPIVMSEKAIDAFVQKHADWIEKNLEHAKQHPKPPSLSDEEIEALRSCAEQYLPERTRNFAKIMDVHPEKVRITLAYSRWGSCSSQNVICYSYRVMLLPPELIDYIIVHELSHILEKNHSKNFYAVVGRYMPDFREREKKIKELALDMP